MTTNQSCATCKFGSFEMTKHNPPRVKQGHAGQCVYDIAPAVSALFAMLPEAVTADYYFRPVRNVLTTTSIVAIPTWGVECPVWEAKEHTGK